MIGVLSCYKRVAYYLEHAVFEGLATLHVLIVSQKKKKKKKNHNPHTLEMAFVFV